MRTLSLVSGWNLINLPISPTESYQAQSLLDEINSQGGACSEIDRWDGSGWVGHIDGLSFNNFDINQGEGYFIKCSTSSDWTVSGYPIESAISLNLISGWNLIGVPYPSVVPYPQSGYLAQSLLDDINSQSGACSEVDRWDGSGWVGHIDGLSFNNFEINNDEGYFVKCSQSSTFTPSDQ